MKKEMLKAILPKMIIKFKRDKAEIKETDADPLCDRSHICATTVYKDKNIFSDCNIRADICSMIKNAIEDTEGAELLSDINGSSSHIHFGLLCKFTELQSIIDEIMIKSAIEFSSKYGDVLNICTEDIWGIIFIIQMLNDEHNDRVRRNYIPTHSPNNPYRLTGVVRKITAKQYKEKIYHVVILLTDDEDKQLYCWIDGIKDIVEGMTITVDVHERIKNNKIYPNVERFISAKHQESTSNLTVALNND